MNFENNFTYLRDLKDGDISISKSGSISKYIELLGEDKHLLYSHDTRNLYVVPHGRFPVFKQIVV